MCNRRTEAAMVAIEKVFLGIIAPAQSGSQIAGSREDSEIWENCQNEVFYQNSALLPVYVVSTW